MLVVIGDETFLVCEMKCCITDLASAPAHQAKWSVLSSLPGWGLINALRSGSRDSESLSVTLDRIDPLRPEQPASLVLVRYTRACPASQLLHPGDGIPLPCPLGPRSTGLARSVKTPNHNDTFLTPVSTQCPAPIQTGRT